MKKLAQTVAIALAAGLCVSVSACGGNAQTKRQNFIAMKTGANLVVYGMSDKDFSELSDGVGDFLFAAEESLSCIKEGTSIYKFNAAPAGGKVEIDYAAYAVLKLALEMYEFTDGAYNPAVYYSVNAFGLGESFTVRVPDSTDELPTEEETDKYASLASHFGEITLLEEDGKYYAVKPETVIEGLTLKVDLGGIGKGWCADEVNKMLEESGAEYGYFDFGGSTMCIKKYYNSATGEYKIYAQDYDMNGYFCGFDCKDERFSTSGSYQRYYELDGVRYCHIIDPSTGRPIRTGIHSATVIGGSAAENDALTTALSVMGVEGAVDFINAKLADKRVVLLAEVDGRKEIITNFPNGLSDIKEGVIIANTVEDGKIVLKDVA